MTTPLLILLIAAVPVVAVSARLDYNLRLLFARLTVPKPKTAEQVSDADKVISGLAQALTDGQVQCTELKEQLDEARKAAKWKDELLKEFDMAAGMILEDAGCFHDDGLVCKICQPFQPFVDARKKYAEHINALKLAKEGRNG
jgi:hypothetical protein